jgi:hypothetical protein
MLESDTFKNGSSFSENQFFSRVLTDFISFEIRTRSLQLISVSKN